MSIGSDLGYNVDTSLISRTIDLSEKGAMTAMFSGASAPSVPQQDQSGMSVVRKNENVQAGNEVRNVGGLKQSNTAGAKAANVQAGATQEAVKRNIAVDNRAADKAHGQAIQVAKNVSGDSGAVQSSYTGGDAMVGLTTQVASAAVTGGMSTTLNIAEIALGAKKGAGQLGSGAKAKLEQKVAAQVATSGCSAPSQAQILRNVGADGADNVKPAEVSALVGLDADGVKQALEQTLQANDRASGEKEVALAALGEAQKHNQAVQDRDDLGETGGDESGGGQGYDDDPVSALALDLMEFPAAQQLKPTSVNVTFNVDSIDADKLAELKNMAADSSHSGLNVEPDLVVLGIQNNPSQFSAFA